MAIIGRRACPWCGFQHAHVKRNDAKNPFLHCPECGLLTQAKNGAQARLLTAGMRPAGAVPEPPPTDQPIIVPKAAPPEPSPAPAAPPRPAGLWEQLLKKP